MNDKLKIIMGDLLEQEVEAIVNPTCTTLLEGGIIDTSIRKLGGDQLKIECQAHNGCAIGKAKITSAYNLKAKHIIHTSSPIWRGGFFGEEKLLRDSYENSLKKALELGTKSIAFPSLSTGTHNFPLDKASSIAIETILKFIYNNENNIQDIYFVCLDENVYRSYSQAYLKFLENLA